MATIKGKISDLTTGLSGGFIRCKDFQEEVFFSSLTKYLATNYEALEIGQDVEIEVKETPRGLFAKSLQPLTTKPSKTTNDKSNSK